MQEIERRKGIESSRMEGRTGNTDLSGDDCFPEGTAP